MDRAAELLADPIIQDLIQRIVAAVDPERILVYGSRARGTQRPDSDYDILVLSPTDLSRWERIEALSDARRGLYIECDLVWYTPEEAAEWHNVKAQFVTMAVSEGIVVHDCRRGLKTPLDHARDWMSLARRNLQMAELDLPTANYHSPTLRHCHETVWDCLKAILALDDIQYPPHRRLTELLDLQVRARVVASLRDARGGIEALHPWAHDVVEPDEEPTEEQAKAAREIARRVYGVAVGEVGGGAEG